MAVVKPFRGWRYHSQPLEKVIVPPYDVVTAEDVRRLKAQSLYNFSHIISPEEPNKYKRAAELLKAWQTEGVFVQDEPCLYFYRQDFELDEHERFCQNIDSPKLTRTGIFATVHVEEYSSKIILPHEKTFSGPKADRFELMKATQGNMEPVFLGYDSNRFSGDEFAGIVSGKRPCVHYRDSADVTHTLWAVNEKDIHAEVSRILQDLKFYILDGHHRYETALHFYKEHRRDEKYGFVLADICCFKQQGTVILPTHRLVRGLDGSWTRWLQALEHDFVLKEMCLKELEGALNRSAKTAFGIWAAEGLYFAEAKKDDLRLDLEVLHDSLLPQLSDHEPEVAYVKSIAEVQSKLKVGEFQLGFLVRPSTYEEVIRVADDLQKMPHKSTFFYPKVPSGLVVNLFDQ